MGWKTKACLHLLTAVLAGMPPDLLRQKIKNLGLLPLVVAFLNGHYAEAVSACNMLRLFCSLDADPGNDHIDLLARLQGVRRLSIFLENSAIIEAAGYQLYASGGKSARSTVSGE
ncbi:hypothetical protein ABBQ32_004686 [Trebouxia sp. C0010 RCD-2024]